MRSFALRRSGRNLFFDLLWDILLDGVTVKVSDESVSSKSR